jgi:uncharacterized protein (DUF2384 family)
MWLVSKKKRDKWLKTPNPGFNGKVPRDMLEAGEMEPLAQMLYHLESRSPCN